MGEKDVPAATSTELPLVKALREVLEHGAPPIFTHDLRSSPGQFAPTNGKAADVPLTAEKAYFEQIIENAPEAISIIDPESAHSAHQRGVHPPVRLYRG